MSGLGSYNITTSLNVDGQISINNTIESVSTTTGSLIVSGGVGITKGLVVGGGFSATAAAAQLWACSLSSGTNSTSPTTGALILSGSGGIGAGGNINASGYISGKNLFATDNIDTATVNIIRNSSAGTGAHTYFQILDGASTGISMITTNVNYSGGHYSAITTNTGFFNFGTENASDLYILTTGISRITIAAGGDVTMTSTTSVGTTINPTSSTGGALNVDGDLVLASNDPKIYFPNNGIGAPTFTNRSIGTKLVLYPQTTASSVDYSLGIEAGGTNSMFFTIPQEIGTFSYKWYGGVTPIMQLWGNGTLDVLGTADSTSSITGILQVSGGVGIAKKLYVGLNTYSNNFVSGYNTTATAASTTTLLATSKQQQYFTGTTTQTVILPVTSTLTLGQSFTIVNNSTGTITLQSSGSNNIQVLVADSTVVVTCILTSGTTAASWNSLYTTDSGLQDLTSPGPIGNSTPSTGAFTTLSASGITSITDATNATSDTTGALKVTGGISSQANIWSGADLVADSNIYGNTSGFNVNTNGTNLGIGISSTGAVSLNCTTESVSTTTGSLIVDGGVGIAKRLNVGGDLYLNNGSITLAKSVAGQYINTIQNTSTDVGAHQYFRLLDNAGSGVNIISTKTYSNFSSTFNLLIESNTGYVHLRTNSISRLSITDTDASFTSTTTVGTTINPTSSTGGALNVDGDLVLASNDPKIYFPLDSSLAMPTFTNRSTGTRIVLYPVTAAATVDYAIGVGSLTFWNSVPDSTRQFQWYAGTTNIMTLTGSGDLTVVGNISGSFDETLTITNDISHNIQIGLGDSTHTDFPNELFITQGGNITQTWTVSASNDTWNINITNEASANITLTVAVYASTAAFIIELETKINAAFGVSSFTVTYDSATGYFSFLKSITTWNVFIFTFSGGSSIATLLGFGVDSSNNDTTTLTSTQKTGLGGSDLRITPNTTFTSNLNVDGQLSVTSNTSSVAFYDTYVRNASNNAGNSTLYFSNGGSQTTTQLKAAIITESIGSWGRSNFHICINNVASSVNLTLTDSVFTIDNATKQSIFNITTDSTSVSTGALILNGGLGIAKNVYVGGALNTNISVVTNAANATSDTTGALRVTGGISSQANIWSGADVVADGAFYGAQTGFNVKTTSTNLGIGISSTGAVSLNCTTETVSATTGSLIVSGGVGITKGLVVGGGFSATTAAAQLWACSLSSGTNSTSPTTGALILSGSGGIGAGGNINASGYISGKNLFATDNVDTATVNIIRNSSAGTGAHTYFQILDGASTGINMITTNVNYSGGHYSAITTNTGFFNFGTENASDLYILTTGISRITIAAGGDVTMTSTTSVGTTINLTSSTGGALNVDGDVVLGASTTLFCAQGSVAFPTLTNRSAGTKIVFRPEITAAAVDFAMGIGAATLWSSIPTSSENFGWYSGTTEIMKLAGSGNLDVYGQIKVEVDNAKAFYVTNAGNTDTVFSVDTVGKSVIIDSDSTTSLLVRKNGNTGNIFSVDTTNSIVRVIGATNATSDTTGALQVTGGISSQANIWSGADVVADGTFYGATAGFSLKTIATNLGIAISSTGTINVNSDEDAAIVHIIKNTNTGTGAHTYLKVASNADQGLSLVQTNTTYSGGLFSLITTPYPLTVSSTELQIDCTVAHFRSTTGQIRVQANTASTSIFHQYENNNQATNYWNVGMHINNNFEIINNAGTGQYMTFGTSTWTAISDLRLKKNIESLDQTVSLEIIDQLNPVKYDFKTDESDDQKTSGLIAQQVQELLPQLVDESDGYLGIRYTELIPYLIGAIKELNKKVKNLQENSTT